MKKIFQMSIIFFLLVFTAVAHASGVLVEAKGSVIIKSGKKNLPPKVGLGLPDGTQLKVGKKSQAQIMLMEGSIVTLSSGETFTVGSVSKKPQKKTVIQGIQVALNEAQEAGRGATVHGMVKMGTPAIGRQPVVLGSSSFGIEGIFPVLTTIEMMDPVTFCWRETEKLPWKNPVLVVQDAKTKKNLIVKSFSPEKPGMSLSARELGLAPGKSYIWYVGMKEGNKINIRGNRFSFSVLSEAAKKSLLTDMKAVENLQLSTLAVDFLQGQVYYKYGLYDRAAQTFLKLYQTEQSTTVKDLLYTTYLKMGLTTEMEKY